MNDKILKIMALALEISPYNENRLYTSKSRVTVKYSTDGVPTLKVTVTRRYERRSIVTEDVFLSPCECETRLDKIIEWLEAIKTED